MADTAGIAVSDAEDYGSEDDSRSKKGAVVNRSRSSLSKPQNSPSKSYLLAATVPHSCVPHTHAQIVTRKKAHFLLVLSPAPRLDPHTDCSFLSCSCSKCNAFISRDYGQSILKRPPLVRNAQAANVITVANSTYCQATSGMKCLPLILFHVFI